MAQSGSSSYKQQVHTEARSPIEVVLARIVYYVFGVIEVIIGARFVLLLSGQIQTRASSRTSTACPGSSWLRSTRCSRPDGGRCDVRMEALLAMAVYALIGWGIVKLIYVVTPRRSSQTVERVEQNEDTTASQ